MPDEIQPVVPGQTPGTTPPFLPPPGGSPQSAPSSPGEAIEDKTKKMLQVLMQAASQKRVNAQPHPNAVPGKQDPFGAPSYMTSGPNPHAWGAQRLMYGVQSMIKNAVAKQKEKQITAAMADWEYAQSALNEYYAAQSSGDPKALESAQKKLDVVFGDPKKLKNMAKSLNQDWLNPEKTTVHGEALKRVAAETQQKDGAKQQAKTGITNMFKKLIGQRQQPQMNDDEKKRMEQEIISKAPTSSGGDPKAQMEVARTALDLEKAAKEARENYQFITTSDGRIMAVNKTNPKDAFEVKDEKGNAVTGASKGKQGLMTASGIPIGVWHNGKPTVPGDSDWTEKDQKLFDAGMSGAKEKQQLRLLPEIAAQVGEPPNPKDFAKGRSDPQYAAALKKFGQEAEAIKEREAAATGASRAKAFNEYRPVQVMDADGNVYYTFAKNAIEQGLSGASEGVKLKPREVQMKDIEVASKNFREAIGKVDKQFSPAQIAKLQLAMSTEDPSIANAEMSALATDNLSEGQQDFVIWAKQVNERAMSLRNVAGMGAGAQDLREAIRGLLPGVRSGNTKFMLKQLDAFDNQVSILKSGIAHPGKKNSVKPKDGVIVVTPEDMK